MIFTNLGDLHDALRSECERVNNPKFDEALPRMVAAAESRLFHGAGDPLRSVPLRLRVMETQETLTLSTGSAALPADFLQAKRLHWTGEPQTFPTYETPQSFFVNRNLVTSGSPTVYTIDDLALYVSPRVSGSIVLYYYAQPAALEDDADTNAVLEAHPMAYFYAALIEAYAYLRNADQMQRAFGSYVSLVSGITASEAVTKRGGSSPMAPRLSSWTWR